MSVKGTTTTADFLNFDTAMAKGLKLLKNKKSKKLGFLIICGINMGLRISDLLSLKYEDFLNDKISFKEQKTKKNRTIAINNHVKVAFNLLVNENANASGLIFKSSHENIYSTQYINRRLKKIFTSKNLNISSHSLRKTFGRKVWENNNENEKALIFLSELFNHSSLQITRIYLGIKKEELENIYLNL